MKANNNNTLNYAWMRLNCDQCRPASFNSTACIEWFTLSKFL